MTTTTTCDTTSSTNNTSEENNNEQQIMIAQIIQQKKVLRTSIRQQLKLVSLEQIQKQSEQVWNQLYQFQQYHNATTIGIFLSMPHYEIQTESLIRHITYWNNKTTSASSASSRKIMYVPIVGQNFERTDMELLKVVINHNNKNDNDDKEINKLETNPTSTTNTLVDEHNTIQQQVSLFYEQWPRNKWNIPEPPNDDISVMTENYAKPGELDLIIVPGLGFDMYGNRLGQGKGYYDRFLARMINVSNSNSTTKRPYLIGVGLTCQLLPKGQTIPTNQYDIPLDATIVPNQTIIHNNNNPKC